MQFVHETTGACYRDQHSFLGIRRIDVAADGGQHKGTGWQFVYEEPDLDRSDKAFVRRWPPAMSGSSGAQTTALTKGAWHNFVLKKVWSSTNGATILWVNGTKVWSKANYPTLWCNASGAADTIYQKIGQYGDVGMDKKYRLEFQNVARAPTCAAIWTMPGTPCPE